MDQEPPASGVIDRLFVAHPRALGVSYFTHARGAVSIGGAMIGAGAACLLHALVPGLFRDRASRTITRLHGHIARRQPGGRPGPENWLDYEI